MSLINQMLQDLDGRRAESAADGAAQGHIRVVASKKNRMHGAWWAVLFLALTLVGVLGWSLLRPAPSTGYAVPPASLALKLAADLSVIPAPLPLPQAAPVWDEKNAAAVKTETVTAAVAQPVDVKNATNSVQKNGLQTSSAIQSAAILPGKLTSSITLQKVADATPPSAIDKQVKELTPHQRAENDYRKATVAIQQGKTAEAIGGLEQALLQDPQHSAARQTLIGVLLGSKRQDEAVRKLQDGLNLDPSQAGLAMILARVQVEKGDLKAAVETLQRTLPHALERADYQAFLAALLQRQARHKEAIEHYSLAVRKTPQSGVWWMGLGISLQAENRMTEAQEAFGRAKSSNSLSPELQAFVEQRLSQLRR